MNKQEFELLLKYHDDLYYNKDNPELSDIEYDRLKNEYIKLYGEYNYVPGEASSSFKKVKHSHPIISLEKVNDLDSLRKELLRLCPVVIQPKLDGLTVVGYPGTVMGHGKFLTRGNGEYGEDITHTGMKIKGINRVKKIDYPVRIEAIMFKSTLENINKKRLERGEDLFKNTRNTAAGMLRNKDASKVEGVSYMAYNIVGSTKSETEQCKQLAADGFIVIPSVRFNADQIDEAIEYIKNFDRNSLDYEIDGLVIKNDEPNSLERFGSTKHHPKNAIAYKFPVEGKWTKLESINYQVGRTGKITPVAKISPVDILGSTITSVTLHNQGIISALNIKPNCEVLVVKANEIIPMIIQSKGGEGNFDFIVKCPSCGSVLKHITDQMFCLNKDCREKHIYSLVHLAHRDVLNIEGLSEETARKMFNGLISKPFDVLNLKMEDILKLPGFAEKSAKKLYQNIQGALNPELKRFIYAAGVPNVGETASEDIANTILTYEDFIQDIKNDCKIISTIHGVGKTIINSLKENISIWENLRTYLIPKDVTKKITSVDKVYNIVITGSFVEEDRKVSRKEIEQLIKDSGHKTSSSVSSNTNYVLVGEKPGTKLDEATKLNIPIINSIKALKEIISV